MKSVKVVMGVIGHLGMLRDHNHARAHRFILVSPSLFYIFTPRNCNLSIKSYEKTSVDILYHGTYCRV